MGKFYKFSDGQVINKYYIEKIYPPIYPDSNLASTGVDYGNSWFSVVRSDGPPPYGINQIYIQSPSSTELDQEYENFMNEIL